MRTSFWYDLCTASKQQQERSWFERQYGHRFRFVHFFALSLLLVSVVVGEGVLFSLSPWIGRFTCQLYIEENI